MKLNEFLAASLPYGLKCQYYGITNVEELLKGAEHEKSHGLKVGELKQIKTFRNYFTAHVGKFHGHLKSSYNGTDIYPIVRPLSDLTKPITQRNYNNGEPFVPIEIICEQYKHVRPHLLIPAIKTGMVDFNIALLLLRWHFDLLEEGIEKVLVTDEFNPY